MLLTLFTINSPLKLSMMYRTVKQWQKRRKPLNFDTLRTFCTCHYWEEETGDFFFLTKLCWQKAYLQRSVLQKERKCTSQSIFFFFREKKRDTHKTQALSLVLSLVGCLSWLVHICKLNNEPITVRNWESSTNTHTRTGHWLGWENLGIALGRVLLPDVQEKWGAQNHVITRNITFFFRYHGFTW